MAAAPVGSVLLALVMPAREVMPMVVKRNRVEVLATLARGPPVVQVLHLPSRLNAAGLTNFGGEGGCWPGMVTSGVVYRRTSVGGEGDGVEKKEVAGVVAANVVGDDEDGELRHGLTRSALGLYGCTYTSLSRVMSELRKVSQSSSALTAKGRNPSREDSVPR